jgi:hypothetical protein
MKTTSNYSEIGIYELREALYLMSQNPPYKFVRLETIQGAKGKTPSLQMIFGGENITEACVRYLLGDPSPVDLMKLKVLASEVENYLKSQEVSL